MCITWCSLRDLTSASQVYFYCCKKGPLFETIPCELFLYRYFTGLCTVSTFATTREAKLIVDNKRMARVDGRKLVVVACVTTATVLAFSQFYLPFWADRDKFRLPPEDSEFLQHRSQNGNTAGNPGSMWKNMKK
jgi:hypothetical protein